LALSSMAVAGSRSRRLITRSKSSNTVDAWGDMHASPFGALLCRRRVVVVNDKLCIVHERMALE
jgi:hypothetical protein